MIEAKLLSKVIDENRFYELNKHGVLNGDFEAYNGVYEFVKDYVESYHQTPDYRTVVAKFEDFDYYPEVTDSFAYLCNTLKGASAKRNAVKRLSKVNDNFNNMSGIEFATWLKGEATAIESIATGGMTTGTNFATNGQERLEWYKDSKEQRTYSYVPTPYGTLTDWLGGGFELGDYILLMAYTNKGKSWIASDIGRKAFQEGFGVLHYSPELSKKQQSFRLDTLIGHFDNVNIRRGQLENENKYVQYLADYDEKNEVPYFIKTMEDLPKGLSIETIQADLETYPNIKMVIIDGFNLMNHPKNGGRDGMTQTSRKLRQLFGRYGVAGLVVHQTPTSAEKENAIDDDDEFDTEIPVPQVTDYSETVAVIQDSATVLTFNQRDGRGRLLLAKCREPHVGESLNLRCNFNLGYITEATPVDNF